MKKWRIKVRIGPCVSRYVIDAPAEHSRKCVLTLQESFWRNIGHSWGRGDLEVFIKVRRARPWLYLISFGFMG